MEPNIGGRERIVRTALAVVFAIIAIRSLSGGNRTRGLMAGTVAAGLALSAITCFCTVNRVLGIDTTGE